MNCCNHKSNLPQVPTVIYCLITSISFVSSLYIFVPPSVRLLPRDHPLHIKWRSAATTSVVAVSLTMYPLLFCEYAKDHCADVSFYVYLGLVRNTSLTESITQDVKILCHVFLLYLGSFCCTWMQIYHYARLIRQEETKSKKTEKLLFRLPTPRSIHTSFRHTYLQPKLQSFYSFINNQTIRWIQLRNLLIAPITEEIMFRSILLPPLVSSGFSPVKSAWITPQFFGVAHFHHYFTKRNECATKQLFFELLLQWSYTTLFGAYASHVFIRTGSLLGIVK